jgi:hypothetical protein
VKLGVRRHQFRRLCRAYADLGNRPCAGRDGQFEPGKTRAGDRREMGVPESRDRRSPTYPGSPCRWNSTRDGHLRLITTLTSFATATDITLTELELEAFLPPTKQQPTSSGSAESTGNRRRRPSGGRTPGPVVRGSGAERSSEGVGGLTCSQGEREGAVSAEVVAVTTSTAMVASTPSHAPAAAMWVTRDPSGAGVGASVRRAGGSTTSRARSGGRCFDVSDFDLTDGEPAAVDPLDIGTRGAPEPDAITMEAFGARSPKPTGALR